EHVDAKVNEFNQTVVDSGFLSPQMLAEELESLEWQKYHLTEDDGYIPMVDEPDMESMEPFDKTGIYYIYHPENFITDDNGYMIIYSRSSSYSKAVFYPFNSEKIFSNTKYGGDWKEWKELTNNQTDTGWVPFQLINGAKTNTAYITEENPGFKCA